MAVDRSTLIQNAQRFMARGQIDKAIEEWQKLVSLTPQDGNLYNTIGDLYLKKNDTPHAIEAFMLAATAFERAGFALKTIAVYKKVLKIDPSSLEVNLKLADLNAERGLTGNAIEDYLKVAKEYGRRGKVQEALEIYRKIASFDPNNTNIRLKLAELSFREKLTDEAVDEYMKVAHIFEQSGRAVDAAGVYKKVLEINPKHAGAREAMKAGVAPTSSQAMPTVADVEAAMAAEDWELAGQTVGVLLLHEATNPGLRKLRGAILLRKGETGLAWADYRGLAEESVRAGRAEESIALLREYLNQALGHAEAAEFLAGVLAKAGRTEEALQAYATLLDTMIQNGSDEADLLDQFKRMQELDPASEVTRRYQIRFEPAPARAKKAEDLLEPSISMLGDGIAEPVPLEPAVLDEVLAAVESAAESLAEEVAEPIAAEAELSADVERSVKPAMEPMAPEPSVSLSRQAEVSQTRARRTAAPLPTEPSVSAPRGTSASQSQSRGAAGQAPPQTTGGKRPRPRDIPDYFAEAEVYLKYGLAGKAIEQFQMILSVDYNNIEAHAKLRELYQLEGRIDEAVTHSVLLAKLYHARGQRDQADQVLSEAREWNPADPRLQAAIDEQSPIGAPAGGAAQEMSAHGRQEAAPRVKQDLQEWLAEAEFYLQQGLDEQAHQLFATIRQHYPKAPEVVAYFENRQGAKDDGPELSAAEHDRSMSRKLADLFPGAFRGVADEGADADADEQLAASVEGVIRGVEEGGQPLSPDGPDPHYSLGLAYKEMGLHAEARKEFEQALQAPAYRIDAALMVASCHKLEGHPRQAVRQLQECVGWLDEQDPKWRTVACELAALHADAGDRESAIAQAQQVLAVQADYEPALTLLKRVQDAPESKHKEAPASKPKETEQPKTKPPKAVKAVEESEPEAEPKPASSVQGKEKEKRYRISYV